MLDKVSNPRRAPAEILWGELAPDEHAVQIYADPSLFIEALEGFVSGGFRAGESLIVMAAPPHRRALERRLRGRGYDLAPFLADDRYLPVDAETALAHIMLNGWPDEDRFNQLMTGLMQRTRGRRVRAFGELVAILWNQGHSRAALRLEHLWNKFREAHAFCLFCAYPRSAFTRDADESILEICSHHSRVIPE